MHLRDLARLSGLAVGTIQREVANLRAAGLIVERRDGNRLYFSANTQNPIFPELRGITLKTTGLSSQLTTVIEGVEGIECAFVYGSFAEGTPSPESDIDLFVIGSIGLRKLVPLLKPVSENVNREINPNVISVESYRNQLKSGDAYITTVTNAAKLWIVGSDDELATMA